MRTRQQNCVFTIASIAMMVFIAILFTRAAVGASQTPQPLPSLQPVAASLASGKGWYRGCTWS
jgi:hypothetical protein